MFKPFRFRETPPRTLDKDIVSTESHHFGAVAANMNPSNLSSEESKAPVMKFSNIQRLLPARSIPEIVSVDRFTFEYIYAFNVEMDVGDANVSSSIMMHDVPAFIVNAFKSFWEIEGYLIEGVFRKEGAAARTKDGYLPVFFGVETIPPNFRVHEICSWIKRFFRDIKTPLFGDKENQLIKFADSFTDSSVKCQLHVPILNLVNGLPVAHCNTLAYLMRCLHEISEHANVNQMTKNNLATVFAPSLFRLHGGNRLTGASKHSKNGRQRQEDMMFQMKRTNELQVLLVETLITHAYEIGLPRDYYKATRRPSDVNKKERRLIASSLYTQNVRPPLAPKIEKIRSQQSRSTTNLSYEYAQSVASSSKHVSDDEDRATAIRKRGKRSNSVLGALKSLKKSVTNMTPLGLMDKEEKNHIFSRHARSAGNSKDSANALLVSPARRISMDPMVKSSDSESPPFIHDISRRNIDDVLKVRSPIRSEKKRAPIPKFESFTPTNNEKKENTGICFSEANDPFDGSFKPIPPIRRESTKVFPLTPVNTNVVNISGCSNRPTPTTNMNRRVEPKVIDRTRRATVPAKLNLAIRRNAPNTKASGLNLPSRGHFSFRRVAANDSFSSATSDDSVDANNSINDVLEASALESRRRRRLKKRNPSGDHSLTNLLQSSLLLSPTESALKTPTKTSTTTTPQVTPLPPNAPVEVPDKLESNEMSDLMTTTDQSSPELRRSSNLHDSVKSISILANPKSPLTKSSPMTSPRALSVDVHVTRPTKLMCSEVTPSSDSGCSSSASSKLHNRHPAAAASISGTTISTISSEASTSTDRCASPVFLEPALPMRFQTHSITSNHSTTSSVVVRPTGTSVYMPTESFRAKCRSPVRRPSSSSTASNVSRKPSRSPGRVPPKHHPLPMRMSTFDSSLYFKDDSRSRFGSSSSTAGAMEWGRPSINQIQGSGVVNLRIQQFNSAPSPTRSSVFTSVPEHPDSNSRVSYKPSFARPTVASSTNARTPVHGLSIKRPGTPQRSGNMSSQSQSRYPSTTSHQPPGFRF